MELLKKGLIDTMDELKPCPFCGGRAEQFIRYMPDNTNYYYIMCSKCKASSNEFFSYFGYEGMQESVEAWNRRVDNDLALSNA